MKMSDDNVITLGELELYVAGLLPDERAIEITEIIKTDAKLKSEVESIENMILKISDASTNQKDQDFTDVLKKIITNKVETSGEHDIVHVENKKPKVISMFSYLGWAAAVLILVFLGFEYQEKNSLSKSLNNTIVEKKTLEEKLNIIDQYLAERESLLAIITSENTQTIELAGQQISPQSKVRVYWNTEVKKVVVDASSLPEAPEGMVYQLWSLKLEPLTPRSLGLLDNYSENNDLFTFENANLSEGFGITLEPAGGSDFPNLEKLYVLGTTNA